MAAGHRRSRAASTSASRACRASRSSARRCLRESTGSARARAALDRHERDRRRRGIHGPTSPSGHCTRTSASVGRRRARSGSSRAAPLACPPPTVTSRWTVAVADADLDPRADGVEVRRRLVEAGPRASGPSAPASSASPAPTFRHSCDVHAADDLDEVEQAVEVEVDERGAAGPVEVDDPGLPRRPRRTCRRPGRSAGCSGPSWRSRPAPRRCPCETNRSMKPSLLTSSNSGCQAVDGSTSPPVNGRCAVDAALAGAMSSYVGSAGAVGERLELVVALAGQVHLRVAVAGEVLAGDAHAPDLQRAPAVVRGVRARRLARLDPPELLLAVASVVVAVVADPQVAPAGPVPVAEQHRQRAVAGRQRDRGARSRAPADCRAHERVVGAARPGPSSVELEVVAERQRRQRRPRPPRWR